MSAPLKVAARMGIWTPIYYMLPWAHPSPNPKRHLDRFSRFAQMTAECHIYFTMGRPFPTPE